MIRGHQFNKVELFQYTTPDKSDEAFEEMVNMACGLVEGLGLHYQLSKLAAGDCSDSMARTYDIEIYIPSMNIYKEVSSASNARDYQARRGNMRYRKDADKSWSLCIRLTQADWQPAAYSPLCSNKTKTRTVR